MPINMKNASIGTHGADTDAAQLNNSLFEQ